MHTEMEKWYRNGLFTKVRGDRFDSESERKVCLILNRILRDYDLGSVMQIRLTPQQALDNYVEVTDETFKDYYQNKNKWMKFDFIFEQVYEYKNRMHYVPVAVVEFDGPHHETEKQKKLDAYKNGVAENIGAKMVRIPYDSLSKLNEEELRKAYEDEIVKAIITGYFTESKNFRKSGDLIGKEKEKQFQFVVDKYAERAKKYPKKAAYYNNLLRLLHFIKELGMKTAN